MAKRILVYNDTRLILTLFHQILAPLGYEVELVLHQSLDLEIINQTKPDLVISDQGPTESSEKEGWQFVQALRMDKATVYLPVIICTGNLRKALEGERHLAEKGMLVLSKPFDIVQLVEAVEKLIGKADASEMGPFHPLLKNRGGKFVSSNP